MNDFSFLEKIKNEAMSWPSDMPVDSIRTDVVKLIDMVTKYHTLHEIGNLILSELETETLFKLAMDRVIEVTKAERGGIAFLIDHKPEFKIFRNLNAGDIESDKFEISRSIIDKVISTKQTICVPNAMEDFELGEKKSVKSFKLLSVLCTPVVVDGNIVGIIYVDNKNFVNLFQETTGDLIDAVSKKVAIVYKNADAFIKVKESNHFLGEELRKQYKFDDIIGSGTQMTKLLEKVASVANTNARVLLEGENGTGKELIAQALHYNSNRCDKPFVAFSCTEFPETLIEAALFGSKKGAFTDAEESKGLFRQAGDGTLFFDEVGEISLSVQKKLLRVLESKTFRPLGSEKEEVLKARIVTATNRNLRKMVKENTFREDLYYRLNTVKLSMPPLRERPEDIMLLVNHFLTKNHRSKNLPDISRAVRQILLEYHYPGNIRELKNIVEHFTIFCNDSMIEVQHLPEDVLLNTGITDLDSGDSQNFTLRKKQVIEDWEQKELTRLLMNAKGTITQAAKDAGIDKKNFIDKLKRYNIDYTDYKV